MLHANKHHMALQSAVGRAKAAIFQIDEVLPWYQKDDLINKIHCEGRVWTKEIISESQQCQKFKFGVGGERSG